MRNKQEVWKTCQNIKTQWLYNRKLITLLISSNYYKLIGIDLSRQTNTTIPQQGNFIGELEEGNGTNMLVITEEQEKTILKFSLDSLNITE